jgi:hypothetical protein
MKIYVFPPSGRIVGIVALKNYLALDLELQPIDLGRGDQHASRPDCEPGRRLNRHHHESVETEPCAFGFDRRAELSRGSGWENVWRS